MGKKPPVRVALDLETTGLQAEHDAILEVAAIKFQGATVLDTLETLVAPGRPVPYRVQRLTGITPQQLSGVPQFESIAQKLQQFIGDLPIVGHSIPFDVGFLRRRGATAPPPGPPTRRSTTTGAWDRTTTGTKAGASAPTSRSAPTTSTPSCGTTSPACSPTPL